MRCFSGEGRALSYKHKLDRGLYTLGVLSVYRLGSYIPVPGINIATLSTFFTQNSSVLGIFNSISGGSVSRMSIMSLNLMPYVSANIIMQLLTAVIPEWRELKQDSFQRRKIQRYSRVLALIISIVQSIGIVIGLENVPDLVINPGIVFKITTVLSIVSGSITVMWLSEQISSLGIGSGSSVVIFTGIICSAIPAGIEVVSRYVTGGLSPTLFWPSVILVLAFTGLAIWFEGIIYKVRIFFKRSLILSTQRFTDLSTSYIPIKLNPAGVLPVMFADSMMVIPALGMRLLDSFLGIKGGTIATILLLLMRTGLILFFCVFCLSFTMNPTDISENLTSRSACVPGVYEGAQTANFFDALLNRVAVIGCVYMFLISVIPELLQALIAGFSLISGTSLLILTSISLDTLYPRLAPDPKLEE